MSVRNGVRWRRNAGKVCGVGFLASCGAWLLLHVGLASPLEDWALALILIFAALLTLIVAVELVLVAWRLQHSRRKD